MWGRRLILGGVSVALAGSVWSVLAGGTCDACHDARALIGGFQLGWIGVVFYAALAVGFWRWDRTALAGGLLLAAIGAHLTLVVFLLRNGILCPPCLVTASGALLAGMGLWLPGATPVRLRQWCLPVGALVTLVALLVQQRIALVHREEIRRQILATVLAERRVVPVGEVHLVIFERADCRYCARFEREMLPTARRGFTGKLTLDKRQADENLPTPTVVVLGRTNLCFVGLPAQMKLASALDQALASDR